MKRKSYQIISVIIMVLMLVAMAGCSKDDKDQASNNEVESDKGVDTQEDNMNKNTSTNDDTSSNDKTTEDEPVIEDETVIVDEPIIEDEPVTDDNGNTESEEVTPVAPEENLTDNNVVPEKVTLEGGIKDDYEKFGITAGTCLSDFMIMDSTYSDIIKENFNRITLENLLKPDYIFNQSKSISTGDIVVEFSPKTIELLDWVKSNGLRVRGHVLIWHSQTPDWIFYQDFDKTKDLVDRDTMLLRMESYIKQAFELIDTLGYTDIFYSYDIVNEAILDNGTLRDSHWKNIIGDDFIWNAFYFADKYAPESIDIYYNDYNEQFKTEHIVKLAKSLVDENGRSLIDGIGCQGHLYTKDSIDDYMSTLIAFSSFGLKVQITELDISLGTWQSILSATEENLKAQGQYYYELVSRIRDENAAGNTNVSGITFWGFADNLSWRRDRSPLLYDKDLSPKYSYYGARLSRDNAGY